MPRPPIKCDHLYIISASIFYESFGAAGKRDTFTLLCANAGIEPPEIVSTWANGGDVIADYIEKLPEALNAARGKENVYFLFHGPGNDVTNLGPWPGGKAHIASSLHRMFRDVWYEGHKILYMTSSYRIPPASNPTAPYNTWLINDFIRQYSPDFWDEGPIFDLYEQTYQNQDFILADGIHPNANGMHAIRAYTAKTLAYAMRGYPTPSPATAYAGKRVVWALGTNKQYFDGINGCVINNEPGSSTTGENAAQYGLLTRATDGTELAGTYLRAHFFTSQNPQGRGNAGNNTASLDNGTLLSSSIYIEPSAQRAFIEICDIPKGLTGTITVTGSRDAGSNDRIGEVTYKGETKTINAISSPAEKVSFPLTVEGGPVRLDVRCQDGSTYAYVSGIQIDFD